MAQFGWDVGPFEKGSSTSIDAFTAALGEAAKREKYVVRDPGNLNLLANVLREAIREVNVEKAVIDSVTTLYITKPTLAISMVLQLKIRRLFNNSDSTTESDET